MLVIKRADRPLGARSVRVRSSNHNRRGPYRVTGHLPATSEQAVIHLKTF